MFKAQFKKHNERNMTCQCTLTGHISFTMCFTSTMGMTYIKKSSWYTKQLKRVT